jgi:hypothetical protein
MDVQLFSLPVWIWFRSGHLKVRSLWFDRLTPTNLRSMLSVDVDILKPDMGYLSVIERPPTASSNPPTKSHCLTTTTSSFRGTLSPPASHDSPPALAMNIVP